jgi:hypothetical protein
LKNSDIADSSSSGVIRLNERYYSQTKDQLDDYIRSLKDKDWWLSQDGGDIVNHELGHQMEFLADQGKQARLIQVLKNNGFSSTDANDIVTKYGDIQSSYQKMSLFEKTFSKYGSGNRHELIAEAFVDVQRNGSRASKLNKELVEAIRHQAPKPKPVPKLDLGDGKTFRHMTRDEELAHAKRAEGLPAGEKAAVKRYTGSDYYSINSSLRGGQIPDENLIRKIDQGLNRGYLERNTILSRGVSQDIFKDMNIGDVFTDHGYISTTVNERASFGGIKIRIEAPAGTKGQAVDTISRHRGEREFLLPRGTKFKILERKQVGGVLNYTVRIV